MKTGLRVSTVRVLVVREKGNEFDYGLRWVRGCVFLRSCSCKWVRKKTYGAQQSHAPRSQHPNKNVFAYLRITWLPTRAISTGHSNFTLLSGKYVIPNL